MNTNVLSRIKIGFVNHSTFSVCARASMTATIIKAKDDKVERNTHAMGRSETS